MTGAPLSLAEQREAEEAEAAARWSLTPEEYRKQRDMCSKYCHPETCSHAWAK